MPMRAEVIHDQTVRTIQINIEPGSVPDLDVTETWHRKARLIRPNYASLKVVDGQPRLITVIGGLVLKSGGASTDVTDKAEWRAESYHDRNQINRAPEWVRLLWNEAPANVVNWRDPAPEEVKQL
jgi:hypothetical protein